MDINLFCRRFSDQESPFDLKFIEQERTLMVNLKPDRAPVFGLVAIERSIAFLEELDRLLWRAAPIDFVVYRSPFRKIFSFGGDLALMLNERGHPSNAMQKIALTSIEMIHRNWRLSEDHDVITVALVAADAMCGGFETALSCDHLIAASTASFALPEISVGLYAGSGAVPFLVRRCGVGGARRFLSRGDKVSACEAYQWGAIDEVVQVGGNEDPHEMVDVAFRKYRAFASTRMPSILARLRMERRAAPLDFEELRANSVSMARVLEQVDESHAPTMSLMLKGQARVMRAGVAGFAEFDAPMAAAV
jgi:DSF synthase